MSKNPWVVTYDHLEDKPVFIVGPSSANTTNIQSQCTIKFRMHDDDGILYYSGVMNEIYMNEDTGEDPLIAFGMPAAGCVTLSILNKNEEWEILIG